MGIGIAVRVVLVVVTVLHLFLAATLLMPPALPLLLSLASKSQYHHHDDHYERPKAEGSDGPGNWTLLRKLCKPRKPPAALFGRFPRITGTSLAVPMKRTMVFGGLYCGSFI